MDNTVMQIILFSLSVAGWLIMIIGFPGNFVPAGVALLYFFLTDGVISLGRLILILVLAISGELVENLIGIIGAKSYGAGRKGMIGALVGSILGGILGSILLPVIGTVIGVFAGAFLLTYGAEKVLEGRSSEDAAKAGKGAVLGKATAVSYKYTAGLVILIVLYQALF